MDTSVALSADVSVSSAAERCGLFGIGVAEAFLAHCDPTPNSVWYGHAPPSSMEDAGVHAGSRFVMFGSEGTLDDPWVSETLGRIFMSVGAMDEPGLREVRLYQSETDTIRAAQSWDSHRRKLEAWASLPPDWDGEGGVTPPQEVIAASNVFIRAAERAGAPVPRAQIAGDGETSYVWDAVDGFASISFLPEGRVVGKVRGGGRETLRFDQPFGSTVGRKAFLQRIAEIA